MSLDNKRILIVEDEVEIAEILKLHLQDQGAEVTAVYDGTEGMSAVDSQSWDLLVLDIQLPGPSGLEICRHVRRLEQYTPVMMLTARTTELDRVIGLDLGADDYVTKPFSLMEMISRIKALFRRIDHYQHKHQKSAAASSEQSPPLQFADLSLDIESRTVHLQEQLVELTSKEFDLLLHFARHPNRVYRRAELLDSVWGYGHEGYEHTVNSHINRLRSKLGGDSNEQYIKTVWGVGYKMVDPRSELKKS